MSKVIVWFVLFCCFPLPAFAAKEEGIWIKEGFLDGEEYLQLPDLQKRDYAMGLLDGILTAPILGADKRGMKWLENCVVDMSGNQLSAILEKELRDNPEEWHYNSNGTVLWRALKRDCPQ